MKLTPLVPALGYSPLTTLSKKPWTTPLKLPRLTPLPVALIQISSFIRYFLARPLVQFKCYAPCFMLSWWSDVETQQTTLQLQPDVFSSVSLTVNVISCSLALMERSLNAIEGVSPQMSLELLFLTLRGFVVQFWQLNSEDWSSVLIGQLGHMPTVMHILKRLWCNLQNGSVRTCCTYLSRRICQVFGF